MWAGGNLDCPKPLFSRGTKQQGFLLEMHHRTALMCETALLYTWIKIDKNYEHYDDDMYISKGKHRRDLDVEQMIRPQILLCPSVLLQPCPQQYPAPCTPFWDAAYTRFPQSIVLPLSGSIAWSIYIPDLFILFQDNFHHCSKCIWKERQRLAM